MELYLIISAVLLMIVLFTLLKLRLKFEISSERKELFLGLGRSGAIINFKNRSKIFSLFGFRVKEVFSQKKKKEKEKLENVIAKPKKKKKRKRDIKEAIKLLPGLSKVFFSYIIGLFSSLKIENLTGELKAGFNSPDITGMLFGYYHAVAASVPAIGRNTKFEPVWDEAILEGRVKGSIAIPLYRVIYLTFVLLIKLPLRELLKLAIGRKEGGQDG